MAFEGIPFSRVHVFLLYGNATLSWYRLLYRLHAWRFQKWTLGMLLCLGIVCLYRLHAERFQKWTLGSLGIVCLYRLRAGRFQKWTLGMQLSLCFDQALTVSLSLSLSCSSTLVTCQSSRVRIVSFALLPLSLSFIVFANRLSSIVLSRPRFFSLVLAYNL